MNSDSNTNSSSEDLHTSSDSDDTTESRSSRSPSPVIDFGEISQRFLNQSMNTTVQVQPQRAYPSLPKPSLPQLKKHCEVCYSTVSPNFLQEESKHLFEIIYCKECKTSAHLICYGHDTPLEEEDYGDDGLRIKTFHCDRCREQTNDRDFNCHICGIKEGCLRLTKDAKWMHTVCGMGSPHVSYEDLSNMSIDLTFFRKDTNKLRALKKCELCKSKVETFKCVNEHSIKHCHVHCALRNQHLDPKGSVWRTYFSIEEQEGLLVHDSIDDQAITANIEDIAFNLRDVIEETGLAKKNYEPLMNVKAKKAPKGFKGKKRISREDLQLTNFVGNHLKKAKKRTEEDFLAGLDKDLLMARENDDYTQFVGGRIIMIHKLEAPKEAQELEVEEEKANSEENLALKNTINEFYKEIETPEILIDVYSEDKLPKIRTDLKAFPHVTRLSFPEVLFFANVFQKRMKATWDNFCTLDDLKNLIESARFIPFSLERLLKPLNEKYCTGIAVDELLKPCIKSCIPESALDWSKKILKKDVIVKNESALAQTREIQNLYQKESCGVITKSYEKTSQYYKQLEFLKFLYENIQKYFNGETKEELPKTLAEILYEKAKNVDLPTNLSEMRLLEEIVEGPRPQEQPIEQEEEEEEKDNMEIEAEEEQPQEEIQLRGRRSRGKEQENEGEMESEGENSEEEEWIEPNEEDEGKARGRKKSKTPVINESEGKKKRGRKPKNNVERITSSEDIVLTSSIANKSKSSNEKTSKRGRPRTKNIVKGSSGEEDNEEAVIEIEEEESKINDSGDIKPKTTSPALKEITNIPADSIHLKKTHPSLHKPFIAPKISKKNPEGGSKTPETEAQDNEKVSAPGKGNRRGRPVKTEKMLLEIEEEFQRGRKSLLKKISMEEAQKVMASFHPISVNGQQRESKWAQEQIRRVLGWKGKYEECLEKKTKDLADLVEQIEGMEIRIPEMSKAVEHYRSWRLWKNEASGISRRLKKKVENIYEDKEEMVSYEEVENAVKESEDMVYVDSTDTVYQELRSKLAGAKKIKDNFNNSGYAWTFSHLKDAEKKLKTTNIRIPEISILKEKLEANYQLQRFLEETMPLDKLIECYAELGQGVGTVDAGLFSHLSTKINDGKRIREDAKRFLIAGTEYNPKPLSQMARLVIRAEENKVQIAELEEIKAIVESFILLSNVYAILHGIQPLKIDHLESEDLGHFKGKVLVELIVGCQSRFHMISSLSDAKITKLRMILEKFEEISKTCHGPSFQESIFPHFFKNLAEAVEKIPAIRDNQSSIPIEDDIEECVPSSQNPYNMEIEEHSYSFREIPSIKAPQNTQQQIPENIIQEWRDEVDGFLHRGPEEKLMEILEGAGEENMDYGQIFESLQELKESSEKLTRAFANELKRTSQVEQENKAVERIHNWAAWTIQAIEVRRQIHEDKIPVEPEVILSLKKKMEEYKLPRSAHMCKTMAEWYKVLDNGMKEYEKMYPESARLLGGTRRDLKAVFGNSTQDEIEKMRVKEIMEKVKQYGGKREAKQMRNAEVLLANISKLFKVNKEVAQIKEDLTQYNNWSDDVEDIGIKYMSYTEEDLATREKINVIKKDLEIIKKKLLELRIWEDADETTLRLLDLMLQSGDLVKFNDKKISLTEARQILEEAVCFGEVDGDGGRLVNLTEGVRKEVDKADTVRIIIKNLKEGQKLNYNDTKRWLECIKNCKIKLDEEQKILEKAQKECNEVKDKVERFLNSCSSGRKSHSSEFKEILDKITGLSIKLTDEEDKVKRAIKVGELIKTDCIRYEKEAKEGHSNVQTMMNLMERYRTSTVYVEEAENIKKALKKIQDTNDYLISKQKELTSSFCSMTFQDLLALEKEISEIDLKGKGETGYEKEVKILRKDILVRKCELISQKRDVEITPLMLKDLITETNKVSRDYRSDERLFRGVHALRDLENTYKEVMEELNKAKSLQELERIQRYVEKVLDISGELTKKREEIHKNNELILEAAKKKEASNKITSFLKAKDRLDFLENQRERDDEREADKYRDGFDRMFSRDTAKETSRQSSQGALRALLLKNTSSKGEISRKPESPSRSNIRFSKFLGEERKSPERGRMIVNKEPPKDRHTVLGDLKDLLESSEHFEMSMSECFMSSKEILKGFPEMLKSAEMYTKIMNKLGVLIRSKYIAESLLKQQFEKTYLKGLLDLDDAGVDSLEAKLKYQLHGDQEDKEREERERLAREEEERERLLKEQEEKERLARVKQQEEKERQRQRQLEMEKEEQRLKEIQRERQLQDLEKRERELRKRLEEGERQRKLEEERLKEEERKRQEELRRAEEQERKRQEEIKLQIQRDLEIKLQLERDLEIKRQLERIEELERQLREKDRENMEIKKRIAREEEEAAAAKKLQAEQQEKRNSYESTNVKTPNRGSKDLLTVNSMPYADKVSTASTFSKIESGTTARKLASDKEMKNLKTSEEAVNFTSPSDDPSVSKRLAFDTSSSKNEINIETAAIGMTEKKISSSKDPRVYKGVSPQRDTSKEINIVESKSKPEIENLGKTSGVLKIFEGTLKYGDSNKEYQMLAFYTCDAINVVSEIPQLVERDRSEIKMEGKMSQNRFETYMNSFFSQWDKKREKIISGWVESPISIYQSRCEQMSKELLETNKISMSTYHSSSKIFFLHKNQIPSQWKTKLNFRVENLGKNSDPSLCFIIVHKPFKMTQPLKCLRPEVVPINPKDVSQKFKYDRISAKSSTVKDAETDFGAEVYNEDEEHHMEECNFGEASTFYSRLTIEASMTQGVEKNKSIEKTIESQPTNIHGKRNYEVLNNNLNQDQNVEKKLKVEGRTPVIMNQKPQKEETQNSSQIREDQIQKKSHNKSSNKSAFKSQTIEQIGSNPLEVLYRLSAQSEQQSIKDQDTIIDENGSQYIAFEESEMLQIQEQVFERLQDMKHEEILAYAKTLDKNQRDSIIQILRDVDSRSKSRSKSTVQSIATITPIQPEIQQQQLEVTQIETEDQQTQETQEEIQEEIPEPQVIEEEEQQEEEISEFYIPPEYIQKIYDLFTSEELQIASIRIAQTQEQVETEEIEEEEQEEETAEEEVGEEVPETPEVQKPVAVVVRNITTTAESSTNNGKIEETKRQEKSLSIQLEMEMKTIYAENETKFMRLKASRTSIEKSVSKATPESEQSEEIVSHNPIIRQRIKDNIQRELSMKQESEKSLSRTASADITYNNTTSNKVQQKTGAITPQPDVSSMVNQVKLSETVKIDGQNITLTKELYNQLMGFAQGFKWEKPDTKNNNTTLEANKQLFEALTPTLMTGSFKLPLENIQDNQDGMEEEEEEDHENGEEEYEDGQEDHDEEDQPEEDEHEEGEQEEGEMEENDQEEGEHGDEEEDGEEHSEEEDDDEDEEEKEEVSHHSRGGYQNNSNTKNYHQDSRSFDFNRYNNTWQNQYQQNQFPRNSHSYSNGYDFQNKFHQQRRENQFSSNNSNQQESWKPKQQQEKISADRRSNISSAKSEINNSRSPLPLPQTQPPSLGNVQPLFTQLLPAAQNNNNNGNAMSQKPFDFNIQNLKNTLNFYANKVSTLTNKAKLNQK